MRGLLPAAPKDCTGAPQPELIYDYQGFSPEIYVLRYDAPGEPKLSALNQSIAINGRGEDAASRDSVELAVHCEALPAPADPRAAYENHWNPGCLWPVLGVGRQHVAPDFGATPVRRAGEQQ